jgi:hypothetical protein
VLKAILVFLSVQTVTQESKSRTSTCSSLGLVAGPLGRTTPQR